MKILLILLCLRTLQSCKIVDECQTEHAEQHHEEKAGKVSQANWLNEHKDNIEKIRRYMNGTRGEAFIRLAYTTDKYGPRLAGSEGLENAINVIKTDAQNQKFVVREENVKVTNWREISSTAKFCSNFRNKSLEIVAYGPSVKGKVTAKILLVKSFDDLNKRSAEAKGKIVVYNQECQDYPTCIQYRNDGASKAAEHGALASLTRSVASFSIYSPHTGPVTYKDNITKIPAAAITIEDAAFIERILKRDPNAIIELNINTETGDDKTSRNLIIDIPGSSNELKHEVLLSGTHTDSWHVDDGIANNAVGCNILYESMRVIQNLGLKPKRTLRLALWTAGEQNARGERQFFVEQQKKKDEKIKLIMRSERGVYNLSGLIINNGQQFQKPVQEIFDAFFNELHLIQVSNVTASENTAQWVADEKIPRFEFVTNMRRYFAVYNSGGDTLDKVTPSELDRAVIIWSTILYILGSAE